MFHLYLTLAYVLPNIYVFFRILFLFIGRRYRGWYTVVYLLLAAIYPVAENLQGPGWLVQPLSAAAGYLLPFYLYVFLGILLFDLFLLVNRLTGWISKAQRKRFRFRLYALSALVMLAAAVVAGGIINMNTIRTSRYRITVPKKDSRLNRLRVAFVADFHIVRHTRPGLVKQFVRKVNALQPDILLYGGDIVEGRDDTHIPEEILAALRSIQPPYGTYGVLGNHESYGSRGNGTFYDKAGITLLRDTLVNIDHSFYLAGRDDERFRQRQTAQEILQHRTAPLPILMLDHRPTQLQEISRTAVDVQFSGHTHHGQLFPINFIIGSMYELSWGHKKIRDTHFFVTSGLRLWGPPVKTAGKSEIVLVDITFE